LVDSRGGWYTDYIEHCSTGILGGMTDGY